MSDVDCRNCRGSNIKRNSQPCEHTYVTGDRVWYYTCTTTQTLFDIPQRPQLIEITDVKPTYTTIKIYEIKYLNYEYDKCVTGDWGFYSAKHEAFAAFIKDLENKQKILEVQLRVIKDILINENQTK